uniref:ANK_REP_REGION domain-containing protein n=1 Tax=Macrostomum lignano TaxID=282301 RepID=A0A1I8H142_9PLAT
FTSDGADWQPESPKEQKRNLAEENPIAIIEALYQRYISPDNEPKVKSVEAIEKQLWDVVNSEKSEELQVKEKRNGKETGWMALKPNGGDAVTAAHVNLLRNDSLCDIFTCSGLFQPNCDNQTALMILASRQDLSGVEYCCLFLKDGDGDSLFGPLVESALLQSEQIFRHLLEKLCRNGCAPIAFVDRPIGGWKFLNADLHQFKGCSLEEALRLCGRLPDRYELIRLAKKFGSE